MKHDAAVYIFLICTLMLFTALVWIESSIDYQNLCPGIRDGQYVNLCPKE